MSKRNVKGNDERAAARRARSTARARAREDQGSSRLARWRPEKDGIEGLARREGVRFLNALGLADTLHVARIHPQAGEAWVTSRLDAMHRDAVVKALARRGVVVDREGFVRLAAEHQSWIRLAEAVWIPALGQRQSVHDRDFCRVAAGRLWALWTPELLPDEVLENILLAAAEAEDDADAARIVAGLRALWAEGRGAAAERLARSGLTAPAIRLAGVAATLLSLTATDPGSDLVFLRGMLEDIRAAGLEEADVESWIEASSDVVSDLDGLAAGLDHCLRQAEPYGLSALLCAGEIVLSRDELEIEELSRVARVIEAALDNPLAERREELTQTLRALEAALEDLGPMEEPLTPPDPAAPGAEV